MELLTEFRGRPKRLLLPLKIPSLVLIADPITRAHRQRQQRQRRILVRACNETRSIDDKEILYVPALIELVQNRRLRVIAHSCGAQLMNDATGCSHPAAG